ncbi:hypothetical protein [Rubrivivax sp. A210]|uniref:hypothetical protein n=1 Tax=Rubrivivax sp. A210 TaxID=2772301 RepID=UPI001919D93B|nr:hypothetical protein [Rubrivivax sp. A210]
MPDDGGGGMPLLLAADLQDDLMIAGNDLERLQRLLDDASELLMGHFNAIAVRLSEGDAESRAYITGAITALQFQDMAGQLIAHTTRRLRSCADRLARNAMGDDDEDGFGVFVEPPMNPNPVTQDEMDAGSIELF